MVTVMPGFARYIVGLQCTATVRHLAFVHMRCVTEMHVCNTWVGVAYAAKCTHVLLALSNNEF